ncbi:MAG: ABC transporter ATP-binding protein [Clostridium sp.]
MENLLELREVTKSFGGLTAVSNVTFSLAKNQILGLIGPNGAGKTTAFNLITGIYTSTSGEIVFDNEVLKKVKPNKVTELGIGRTFQNIRLFKGMSVLENVMIGQYCRTKSGFFSTMLSTPSFKKEENKVKERAEELLEFVGLYDKKDHNAVSLPYGDQRKVEIARALATNPKLLLLDEPAAGMNTQEKREMQQLIANIKLKGYTVLLIEHDMKLVMGICDSLVVLDHGTKIAQGLPAEIQKNENVISAYLGRSGA